MTLIRVLDIGTESLLDYRRKFGLNVNRTEFKPVNLV